MPHNVTECQRRLIDLGFLVPVDPDTLKPSDDGKFGQKSLNAYNHFLASKGRPPVNPPIHLDQLNADLFPEEQPPPIAKSPSIFDQIGTLLSLISFLKGKPVTSDQLTGIVRTLAVYLVTLAASHGWLPTGASSDVVAAIVAVGIAAWSIWSNRAKTIVPIASK